MKTLEQQRALTLRTQGLSYREIQQQLFVSRSSLSRWLQAIPLTAEQRERIHQKNLTIRRRFVAFNGERSRVIAAQKAATRQAAAAQIGPLTIRELQLIGAALYWGEGTKAPGNSIVEIINADPKMIVVLMRWFRECCEVTEQKFHARVQLHAREQQAVAEAFWSQLTGIPLTQFTAPLWKTSRTSQRKRGNCLPYGTLQIRIADVSLLTRIHGWIEGLGMAPSSSPA